MVFLGDPQQLPQVTQADHPGGSGASVLEHLLQGESTIAADRGVLLTESWRMHPDVCTFVSERSYEGKLRSRDACGLRRVEAPAGGLTGTGLRVLEVEHEGRSQASPEEAEAIASACRDLLDGGSVTDDEGEIRALRPEDIMVVAPVQPRGAEHRAGSAAQGADGHCRPLPGPARSGGLLRDDVLVGRGRAAGRGLPVQRKSVERGGVASGVSGGTGAVAAAALCGVSEPGGDGAGGWGVSVRGDGDGRGEWEASHVTKVLGVDAAGKAGWVAVCLLAGQVETVRVERSFETLAHDHSDCEVIAVDMPIGLPEDGHHRECDRAARDFVGKRHLSVFPAPSEAILEAPSHAAASELSKRLTGKGVSRQTYGLRGKIWEVAEIAGQDSRVIEVHPEVSFCALVGSAPLAFAKKTWNGQMQRRELLHDEGIDLPDELEEAAGIPVDDVLDAAAAAWSAQRYAAGSWEAFPNGAQPGNRRVIWY